MRNFFNALLWFLLLALIALFFNYLLGEKICGVCSGTENTQQEQVATGVNPSFAEFMITDSKGKTLFKFPKGFIINSTNGKVKIPEDLMGFKDSIFNFMNANQGKEMLISAKYLKSEGEPRGLDRANFLKHVLVKAGLDPNRIIPKAVLSDYNYDGDHNYYDGIAMLFRNLSDENAKLYEEGIANKTLYSDFASEEFKPDRTLQGYAYALKNYLDKYPDKKVKVTGHTDNVGEPAANKALGLKRAINVMEYLVSRGVNKNDITAVSRGEEVPIADNSTDEGRAKNRRINVVVQ